jgi:hypothetical protein
MSLRPFAAAVTALSMLMTLPASGQDTHPAKEVRDQTQVWLSLNSTTRVTNAWGVIADVHARRTAGLSLPSFYLLRVGGQYWLSEKLTVVFGYAHMWNAPSCNGCDTWAGENRLYQQVQYGARVGRIGIVHRLRNEQRWKDVVAHDALTGATSFSTRVRYLASLTVPISARRSVPSFVLADEVLLQFGRSVVLNTFDQNRLFAGVRERLSRTLSVDAGYMLVYQQKATGYQYDRNHTLRCFFYFTPDLRRAKPGPPAGME